ncbi:MAG: hypothetical protein WAK88_13865, partial [Candidatus Cybelea sp.]
KERIRCITLLLKIVQIGSTAGREWPGLQVRVRKEDPKENNHQQKRAYSIALSPAIKKSTDSSTNRKTIGSGNSLGYLCRLLLARK